jgi:hypothetical protein
MISSIQTYLQKKTSAAPLAIFRMALGLMLFAGSVRFWYKGWIYDLYIKPVHYFPYYGFEWVQPLGNYTYILFGIFMISSILVALGLYYRISVITLFLSFTYIELIDKSTYLNHYYFVSLICLLLVFLPANVYFSVDAYRNRTLLAGHIPRWCIDSVKLLVFILYFYAGLAKLNSDWLLNALPLKIWLPARNDTPIIGFLFNHIEVAYLFSWFGCAYDLLIGFLLWNRRTRVGGYFVVIIFHLMTALLFPIGMFPYIMIVTGIIFFSGQFHQNITEKLGGLLNLPYSFLRSTRTYHYSPPTNNLVLGVLTLFFVFQLVFPFRYLAYPGELFWTEQGYRFSWRVMLMEKTGYTQFVVKDESGKIQVVNNSFFLSPLQEKMMSTQPDMILHYTHILKDYYSQQGFQSPQIFVDSYVTLNGRLGKPLIAPDIDLTKYSDSFLPKTWISPLNDEIKGF